MYVHFIASVIGREPNPAVVTYKKIVDFFITDSEHCPRMTSSTHIIMLWTSLLFGFFRCHLGGDLNSPSWRIKVSSCVTWPSRYLICTLLNAQLCFRMITCCSTCFWVVGITLCRCRCIDPWKYYNAVHFPLSFSFLSSSSTYVLNSFPFFSFLFFFFFCSCWL